MSISPYEILGVAPNSDLKTIKRQYKKLIRQYTPEHAPEKFMEIRSAYDFIVHPPIIYEQFPVYHTPIKWLEEKLNQTEETDTTVPLTVLQSVFETPFNTSVALKKMVQQTDMKL